MAANGESSESAAAGFGLGQRPEVETYAILAPDSQAPFFYFYLRTKTGRKNRCLSLRHPSSHLGTLAHHEDIFSPRH